MKMKMKQFFFLEAPRKPEGQTDQKTGNEGVAWMDKVTSKAHNHQRTVFEERPFVTKQANWRSKLAEIFFWAKILLKQRNKVRTQIIFLFKIQQKGWAFQADTFLAHCQNFPADSNWFFPLKTTSTEASDLRIVCASIMENKSENQTKQLGKLFCVWLKIFQIRAGLHPNKGTLLDLFSNTYRQSDWRLLGPLQKKWIRNNSKHEIVN